MRRPLVFTAGAMFAAGYAIGFHFAEPLLHFFMPEWLLYVEATVTTIPGPFSGSHRCGLSIGTMFAAAPVAVLASGRSSASFRQVFAYFAISTGVSLFVALLNGASFSDVTLDFGEMDGSPDPPTEPFALPPYYGAAAVIFYTVFLRDSLLQARRELWRSSEGHTPSVVPANDADSVQR